MSDSNRIVLAVDELSLDQCLELASKVGDWVYAIKIHNVFDQQGPDVVQRLRDAGARRIWVDAKLHDIPNTVKLRAKAIAESGADILTVHASGEIEMMMAAVEAGPSEIYAITVLTSLGEEQAHLLHGQPSKAEVLYLARLAKLAGVHGIVCSPKEVGILAKRSELQGLKFITPGVRSPGKATDDQKRVDTPAGAIASGSTHLVVGRQITQATDPVDALCQIEEEISPNAMEVVV
ncbi:MAG: orotidine-5'-phosphate decarboxylase [Patescibacteria group bacterium]